MMRSADVIQDQASARKVLEAALEASAVLDRALSELQPLLPDAEFAAVRKAVGQAMGEIHCELIRPLWKQHPELAPDD